MTGAVRDVRAWIRNGVGVDSDARPRGARTVNDNELEEVLENLEREMHLPETRRNRARMQALLHSSFFEFGRSGRRYTCDEILEEFAHTTQLAPVVANRFELNRLADDLALLTYASAHVSSSGDVHRTTLRSSLWKRTQEGWKVLFHQGTPADGLEFPAP